jgi:hypothetical protein
VTDHLDDIASDLSAFHQVADASRLEARVFFMLAMRLPAYPGVMASVAARQREGGGQRAAQKGYERTSPKANNPRVAASAPPATPAALAALNAQLGSQWFSVRTVSAAEIKAAAGRQPDLRETAQREYPELRGGDA